MLHQSITGFRLSSQQERAWTQQQRSENAVFTTQCAVLVDGPVKPSRLLQALRAAVSRHEILRTVFHRQPGLKLPFQVIRETIDVLWEQVEVNPHEASDPESQAEHRLAQVRTIPFDLEKGPLLRASLVTLAADKFVLLMSVPALCSDARGLQRLVHEVFQAYASPDFSSPEVTQYADIVEWQRELLESKETAAGREFWRDYGRSLSREPLQSPSLPLENQAAEANFAPSIIALPAQKTLVEQLDSVSAQRTGSAADILLSAWHVLLWRLIGSSPVVSCAFDGRKYEELENAVGLLTAYLPTKPNYDADATFSAVVQAITDRCNELQQWQESFAWNDVDASAASQFAFEYTQAPPAQTYGDVTLSWLRTYSCTDRFKLKLVWVRSGPELLLQLHYDAARLSRAAVEHIGACFQTLLTAALALPDTAVSRLPLLPEAEQRRLLVDWNQTAAPYPNLCLHQLFEQQVQRTPDRPALRFGQQVFTYAELNQRANRLAHCLRRHGVAPDRLVAVCLERSADMIVALLAIMKAGGAYVPLNPDNPKLRLAQQLTGVAALLTQQSLLSALPDVSASTLCLDRDEREWNDAPADNPELTTTADHLVYVIYTSGSTGVPKGVAVRHRNLVNYTHFITRLLELERYPDGLHFATVSTLAADLGNTAIFPALVSGGCLHVISYDVGTDPQRFAAYTEQYPIDVLKIVPSHLAALLNSSEAGQLLPRRYLITGGESLSRTLVDKISTLAAGCELINHYGPTETTVGSLTFKVSPSDGSDSLPQTIPIGRPIANTQVYILDAHQQPVPVGVAGELYIGGDGVTAGYLNQPEATAERFLPNPFLQQVGARMYRSGDRARYRPDGAVEFLGRSDDQVKIRGFRIELGEIESLLAQHAAIQQAVVVARAEQEDREKRLLAYVVLRPDQPVSSDELTHYLQQRVPNYMVPAAIIPLTRLPLTSNGKVDRQALPAPEQVQAKAYLAPRTATEVALAAIWTEVLRRDRISVDDNFFELGGHSLLATQVISRVRRILNTDVPLRTLFESPTIAQLASEIDSSSKASAPPIVPVRRDQPLPLSFAQQRLWVLDQMQPNNPLYNVPRGLRVRGPLNDAALEQALNEIVRRHESQRTTFAVKGGEPVQVIAPSLRIPLLRHDLAYFPGFERESEAQRIATEEAQRPFDLAKGPLLRALLVRMAVDDHVLLLTMHHIVSDAWSAGVFLKELTEIYDAFANGRPSPLHELPIQYADYACWQRQLLSGENLQRQLSYWRERLKGAPEVLNLPTSRPRPKLPSYRGAYDSIPLASDFLPELRRFSQQEDATLFMTLLAGFQALLSRLSGQDQIVVGTDVANRSTTELERLIGFFINLLPLRTNVSGDPTFRELLSRVREVALGAYAHQEVPFEKLVEELRLERSLSHNPLVQVLFVMQNIPPQRRELAGLTLSSFPVPITRSKFDLAVFMVETEDTLIGNWLYSTDLFDRDTVFAIARQFETLLRHAVARPHTRVSALEILSDAEKQQRTTQKEERKQAQLSKLKAAQPRAIGVSSAETGGDNQ